MPELTMNRGEPRVEFEFEEQPNESSSLGLLEPRRELIQLELETVRTKLAYRSVALLTIFILAGISSITWVTLAGKSATELNVCVEMISAPLFGLAMLIAGYYFGHSKGRVAKENTRKR